MKMDFLVEQKSAIENFTLFFNDEKLARFYQFFQLRFVADSHLVTWQQSSYTFFAQFPNLMLNNEEFCFYFVSSEQEGDL